MEEDGRGRWKKTRETSKQKTEIQMGRESAGGLLDVLAGSSEVHGVLGVIVDLNCLGQRLGVPTVTLA